MEWLFYIWLSATAWITIHSLLFYGRLVFYKAVRLKTFSGAVSVVICARNEAENLEQYVPLIALQKYQGLFEVLIVDDHSTDHTRQVLTKMQQQYPVVRAVRFTEEKKSEGKKEALAFGLQRAKYGHIVLTDADCRPSGTDWLQGMADHFSGKEIVLGYSGYDKTEGILNRLARWETFQTAIQYMSLSLMRLPYMGVGRNLGYTYRLFEKSDQFASHVHIASGDDDLFIRDVSSPGKVAVSLNPKTFTWSASPRSWRAWWRQKQRHLTTSVHYKTGPKLTLGLYGLSTLSFYGLGIFLVLMAPVPVWFWWAVFLKTAIQFLLFIPLSYRFRCKDILWLFPLWEAIVTVSLSIIHIQNLCTRKPLRWN